MAELNPEIVLQSEHADGFHSRSFTGVPAARRSWICIASSGSDQGRDYVRQLAEEIETALRESSPTVEVHPAVHPPPMDLDLEAQRDRRNLLVLMGSADRPFTDTPWYERWQADDTDAAVMVVLPAAPYETMFDGTITADHLLRRINASVWQDTISEALPGILARAEVTSAISRIFISYRRVETLAVALQLFDRLTHEGFEVFLDRFSIPAGYDFQRRLNQELEDKSMVVLLESKHIRDSHWTQHEIDFAKRHRLGLATIRMPDVKDEDALPSTTIGPVVKLGTAGDFSSAATIVPDPVRPGATMSAWSALGKDAEDRVVAEIKRAHAAALFRRRHRLRTDLVEALAAAGLQVQATAVGPLQVRHLPDEHLVWITTHPPTVDDFRSVYAADAGRARPSVGSRGLIVGPQAAQEGDRRERLSWLQTVSRCLSFDEGDLAGFARCVKERTWP